MKLFPGSYVNTINKCAVTRHNCQILQRLSSCFIAVCLVFGHQIKQFPLEHKKTRFPIVTYSCDHGQIL